jgi:hypothetical protein
MSRISEPVYPNAPGFKRPGPSEQSARAVSGMASKLRTRVLEEFKKCSLSGATADEIAAALNTSILSVRPRVSELHRTGAIVGAGARRKNESGLSATVWKIAEGRSYE